MKIKLLDYGMDKNCSLARKYYNDAGIDVYNKTDFEIKLGQTKKVPLGFGIELPTGFAGFIVPRSGLSSKGFTTELAPIDSSYSGEIHAIMTLQNKADLDKLCDNQSIIKLDDETVIVKKNTRISQLVIVPIILAELVNDDNLDKGRGSNGFGSTGIK